MHIMLIWADLITLFEIEDLTLHTREVFNTHGWGVAYLKIWLLRVNFEKFTSIYKRRAFQMIDCNWSRTSFAEANFSKSTDNNQFFRNDFVCIHYHLSETLAQSIERKFFNPLLLFYTWKCWVICPPSVLGSHSSCTVESHSCLILHFTAL